jgi:ArsR family transcriptional regulator
MSTSKPETFALQKEELPIDAITIKKAAFLVSAVNHPVRQLLLQVISREKEITVTALRLKCNMEQPNASSQLAVLRKAGVVSTRREGHRVLYSVRRDYLELLDHSIQQFIN